LYTNGLFFNHLSFSLDDDRLLREWQLLLMNGLRVFMEASLGYAWGLDQSIFLVL